MRFFSDNAAPVHPRILDAIAAANGQDTAYDGDALSKRLDGRLSELFERVEIVAEKDAATYSRVVSSLGAQPEAFCMIGNSVRSDIAPVLQIGGAGVHVPYHVTWALEQAELDTSHPRLARVTEIREAPSAIALLDGARP